MNGYELGQVFEHIGPGVLPARYDYVTVCDVRGPDHPKGLGEGMTCALALPWPFRRGSAFSPWRLTAGQRVHRALAKNHPLDVVILCRELPSHGDDVWRLVDEDGGHA